MAVTAVAAGDRRNWTVAAVAAVPERGVLQRGRARTSRRGRRWRREGKRRGRWRGLRRLPWRRRRRQRQRRRRRATRLRRRPRTPPSLRRSTSRLDSRARVQPRPPGPASAALAVSAVARLPREQAGTVSIASGAQARRVVRAGTANAERGRALGAGRVGARASAPWSGPGGREPTRPLGDLRAGQQPGAQDEHPASIIFLPDRTRSRPPRPSRARG